MIRVASRAVFVTVAVVLAAAPVRGQLPVAPPPREVRTDGTREPAPAPESPAKAEDPAAVVDRIIKNSTDVGDKLAKTDTGADTRMKQDKILSDIDALINRQEDTPPPKPDDNKDKEKDKDKEKNKDKDPMTDKDPDKSDMPPKGSTPMDKDKGMGMGKDGMPMGGMNDPPPMPLGGSGRKPRTGDPMGDKKEPEKADPKPDPMGTEKKPSGDKEPKEGKNPSGAAGGGGKPLPKASLPFDEDVAKDVWGHLNDKLRQQMTQYYKEDVMPKYAELLRLYYSSLSEKGGSPPAPPQK